MTKLIFAVVIFSIGVLLLAIMPLALVASLNVLFSLGISYSFSTWLAALFILLVFAPSKTNSLKQK